MDVVHGVAGLDASHGRLFVVVGVFDGLHLGHAYLLRHLVSEAATRGARPAVVTFDSHPDEILIGAAPPLLLDPSERVERLRAAGVTATVVQPFDQALRVTPYDAFVEGLASRVDLAGFLLTPDAAFGYERRGTPTALAALGAARRPPFDVVVVPPFSLEGRPVRSTEIRSAIGAGDLAGAAAMLGRDLAVTGVPDPAAPDTVVFPMPVALPPPGDYRVRIGPAWRPGWRGRDTRARVEPGRVRIGGGLPPGPARVAFTAGGSGSGG